MISHDPEKEAEKEELLRPSTPSQPDSLPPPYDEERQLDRPYVRGPTGIFFVYGMVFSILSIFILHITEKGIQPFLDSHGYGKVSKKVDFSHLHYSKMCPGLEPIGLTEFQNRRTLLGDILKGDGSEWGAWVSEPGPNTLYYTNLTTSNWYLSERPWLIVISPSSGGKSHLSVLTPSFELSRSQRLPFAINKDDEISWVTWEEAENPYSVLIDHLSGLKEKSGFTGESWSVELEENVREFVSAGLTDAGAGLSSKREEDVRVGFAKLEVREQRMRKTEAELKIQRCAAMITLQGIRDVRKHLKIGMTELDGEDLIRKALTAGGLTSLDIISLFGANAALPHASASASKRLEEGEFVLFDCGGDLMGYISDFTRTVLPDPPKPKLGGFLPSCKRLKGKQEWPSARAQKVWETVKAAQVAALGSLVSKNETVWAANVDKAARDIITDAGWGEFFTHRVGHGIGLQVHEHPYLNSGNFQPLQPGETFSNEPGIYIEESKDKDGSGIGVRLEDMVLKTEYGWQLLSGSLLARSPWDP